MFSYTLFLSSLLFIASAQIESESYECWLRDDQCLNALITQEVATRLFVEDPTLDPMFFDFVEGNLNVIKYKLTNSTITGYNKCYFSNIDIHVNQSRMLFDLFCPSGNRLVGNYEVDGHVADWHARGKGFYEFILGAFYVKFDARLGLIEADDGKAYLKIKDFISTTKLTSPFKTKYTDLSDENYNEFSPSNQAVQRNWLELADLLQEPILMASFKRVLRSANKYMKPLRARI